METRWLASWPVTNMEIFQKLMTVSIGILLTLGIWVDNSAGTANMMQTPMFGRTTRSNASENNASKLVD